MSSICLYTADLPAYSGFVSLQGSYLSLLRAGDTQHKNVEPRSTDICFHWFMDYGSTYSPRWSFMFLSLE